MSRKPPRSVVAHEVMSRSHYERPYTWKVLGAALPYSRGF